MATDTGPGPGLPTLPAVLVADATSEAGEVRLPGSQAVSTQCPVLEGTACANCTGPSLTRAPGPGRREHVEGLTGETPSSRDHTRPAGHSRTLCRLCYPFTDPSWSEKGDLKEKAQCKASFWLCLNIEPIPRTTRSTNV